MPQADTSKRHNRTLTVDCHDEITYSQLPGDGKAFVEFVIFWSCSHQTLCVRRNQPGDTRLVEFPTQTGSSLTVNGVV